MPYDLWIERDLGFEPLVPLSQWADTARRAGSILWAERLLRRAAQTGTDPEDPLPQGR